MTSPSRSVRLLALVAGVFPMVLLALAPGAEAAVQPFSLSAASGPPGTVVTASGTGCSPGLIVDPTQDRVSLSSTTFPVAVFAPANADGSWSTSFTIPANALPLPAIVEAVCFKDGLPSLATIYLPQTFTVTGTLLEVPTTPTLPPTTEGPNTPNTTPPSGTQPPTNQPPGTPVTTPAGPMLPVSPGDDGSKGSDGSGGGSNSGGGGIVRGNEPARALETTFDPDTAAALRTPKLDLTGSEEGSGLGWPTWLLLALIVAAILLAGWLVHMQRTSEAVPAEVETS